MISSYNKRTYFHPCRSRQGGGWPLGGIKGISLIPFYFQRKGFGSLRLQEIFFAFGKLPLFHSNFIDATSSIHISKLYLLFCLLNESFPNQIEIFKKCDCLIHAIISIPDHGISL